MTRSLHSYSLHAAHEIDIELGKKCSHNMSHKHIPHVEEAAGGEGGRGRGGEEEEEEEEQDEEQDEEEGR